MKKAVIVICEKCNREVKGVVPIREADADLVTESFLADAELMLLTLHTKKEHTVCAVCKNKIADGEGSLRILSKNAGVSEEDREKGIEFQLIPGVVCYMCFTAEE
ncbi:MAG: hypothetical protein Q8P39_01005 [Candidatus Yanofskybacteria bacterium]|nr:hypothetical protein [Candidatus Yanofskybacteria bacterium]